MINGKFYEVFSSFVIGDSIGIRDRLSNIRLKFFSVFFAEMIYAATHHLNYIFSELLMILNS